MTEDVQDTPQPSIEDQAREMGWKPREEFEEAGKDVSRWVSAETFVARAPLIEAIESRTKHIKTLKSELDSLKVVVSDLTQHNRMVKETEFKRALAELRNAKREALENDDHLRAEDIQEKIEEVKTLQQNQPPAPQVQPSINEDFARWAEDNQWYKSDQELRDFADALGIVEHKKGKTPSQILDIVAEKVRKQFPEKFKNPMRDKPAAVETTTTSVATTPPKGFKPTPEQREIAKRFVASGVFAKVEDYYKQLAEME